MRFEQPSPDTLQLSFTGSWRLQDQRPAPAGFEAQLASTPGSRRVTLLSTELGAWDSGLVTYLARVVSLCRERNIEVDASGLPEGARRLLELAFAVPPKKDTGKHGEEPPTVARIGMTVLDLWRGMPEMIRFIGEATQSLGRFLTGRAQYRLSDLLLVIQDAGPNALPIVSIISFLVGLIVAYMGAVQLAQFGAQIYIADLVAIGMVREMGALMTGIIMAGRTGAAFAEELSRRGVGVVLVARRRAALDEVSHAMRAAEAEGRMVRKLPIGRIDATHLNRDRMVLDPEEMETLKASIAARGQQTPFEVLQLSSGRFGLISGLRRLAALRKLYAVGK